MGTGVDVDMSKTPCTCPRGTDGCPEEDRCFGRWLIGKRLITLLTRQGL